VDVWIYVHYWRETRNDLPSRRSARLCFIVFRERTLKLFLILQPISDCDKMRNSVSLLQIGGQLSTHDILSTDILASFLPNYLRRSAHVLKFSSCNSGNEK
jgi:hypothetical protein